MLVKRERYLLNDGVSIHPNPLISVTDVLDRNIVVNAPIAPRSTATQIGSTW